MNGCISSVSGGDVIDFDGIRIGCISVIGVLKRVSKFSTWHRRVGSTGADCFLTKVSNVGILKINFNLQICPHDIVGNFCHAVYERA